MSTTGKRRLLKLADFLETKVPPERFNLHTWAEGHGFLEGKCGTFGCAIGWAASIPAFKRAGLRLYAACGDDLHQIQFGEREDYPAVEAFFHLNVRASRRLFSSASYKLGDSTPPKLVAQRIRKFVAKHAALANTRGRRGSEPASA